MAETKIKTQAIDTERILGWEFVSEVLTYSNSTTVTIVSGGTNRYQIGDKIRYKQGGSYKYGVVIGVTSTTLTIFGGSDFTIANSAITDVYVSRVQNPFGFPDWFNYSITVTWNGTTPGGTTTIVSKFRLDGRTCFVFVKGNYTTAGANNTQLDFAGPMAAAVTAGEYSIPGNGLVSNAEITTLPSAAARAVGYGTGPQIYLFFSSLSAKSFEAALFYPV